MYLVLLCIWMKVFQEQARLLSDVQKKKEGKLKLPESSQPMMFSVFSYNTITIRVKNTWNKKKKKPKENHKIYPSKKLNLCDD